MSSLKKSTLTGLFTALVFSTSAYAGLYGFDEFTPYTQEEKLLNMEVPPHSIMNYRDLMRENVISLSNYARSHRPDFQIMVHEGQDLLTHSLWEYHLEGYIRARNSGQNVEDASFLLNLKQTSPAYEPVVSGRAAEYVKSINSVAVNNHYCGNIQSNPTITDNNLKLVSIDHCANGKAYDQAVIDSIKNKSLLYAFLHQDKAFRKITAQPIINENAKNIFDLNSAQNISFLLYDTLYDNKNDFIEAVRASNYDVVVIEPYFRGTEPFTPEDVNAMQYKKNGAKRLLLAQFSVSEAKNTDYYWNNRWKIGSPEWLIRSSFTSPNSVITQYWNDQWKTYMARYFKGVVASGYDGAFLTGLENHQYFERLTPLE